MENTRFSAGAHALTRGQQSELKRLGIRRGADNIFLVGAEGYANLADAIAQAKHISSGRKSRQDCLKTLVPTRTY